DLHAREQLAEVVAGGRHGGVQGDAADLLVGGGVATRGARRFATVGVARGLRRLGHGVAAGLQVLEAVGAGADGAGGAEAHRIAEQVGAGEGPGGPADAGFAGVAAAVVVGVVVHAPGDARGLHLTEEVVDRAAARHHDDGVDEVGVGPVGAVQGTR